MEGAVYTENIKIKEEDPKKGEARDEKRRRVNEKTKAVSEKNDIVKKNKGDSAQMVHVDPRHTKKKKLDNNPKNKSTHTNHKRDKQNNTHNNTINNQNYKQKQPKHKN